MFSNSNKQQARPWHLAIIIFMIAAAIGFRVYAGLWPKMTVHIGGQDVRVLVADTFNHRFEGWSNHKTMQGYGGMLFVFPERSQHTMVMRDMEFPLDIVWLDSMTIVDMAPNLPPERGKMEAELTPYFARLPSTLVLELPAGFIQKNGLKIGDEIDIITKY